MSKDGFITNKSIKSNFDPARRIKNNLLVSVIFLGIPLDLTGITGADDFFILEAASVDFCNSSALKIADFGFRLTLKCSARGGCCPTYKKFS